MLHCQKTQVEDWWNSSLQNTSAQNKNKVAAILLYTIWNIWNERNRRIFLGLSQTPTRILSFIKEEMAIRPKACEDRGTT